MRGDTLILILFTAFAFVLPTMLFITALKFICTFQLRSNLLLLLSVTIHFTHQLVLPRADLDSYLYFGIFFLKGVVLFRAFLNFIQFVTFIYFILDLFIDSFKFHQCLRYYYFKLLVRFAAIIGHLPRLAISLIIFQWLLFKISLSRAAYKHLVDWTFIIVN